MSQIPCPNCQKPVQVPDGMAGRQMRCPNCRAIFPIPGEPAKPAGKPVAAKPPAVAAPPAKPAPQPAKPLPAAKPAPSPQAPQVKRTAPTNQGVAKPVAPVPGRPTEPGVGPKPLAQPKPVVKPSGSSGQGVSAKPGSAKGYPHIDKKEGQPARLQRVPGIRIAQLVIDYLAYGWSPEEMCRQHPHLSPGDAHAAMTYYYDHRVEIDQEIQQEINQVEQDKAKSPPAPVLLRMRSGSW